MSREPDWRLLLVKRAMVTGFIVSDHFGQMERCMNASGGHVD
jgi:NADPH-dependent curcumin reductase